MSSCDRTNLHCVWVVNAVRVLSLSSPIDRLLRAVVVRVPMSRTYRSYVFVFDEKICLKIYSHNTVRNVFDHVMVKGRLVYRTFSEPLIL